MQDLLFHGRGELTVYFKMAKEAARKEVESIDTDSLLNSSEGDFVKYFIDKYSIDPPILNPEGKSISAPSDVNIDISRDRASAFFDGNQVKGVSMIVAVPFSGEGVFFQFTPSPFTYNPPRGEVVGQEVHLVFQQIEHNAEELGREISRRIRDVQQHLDWVKSNIEGFNKEFETFIREALSQRKRKKLKDLDLVAKLGIPIKKREDMPRTYAILEVKRRPKIARPTAAGKPFAPEPTLEMEEYENILSIVRNMAMVLERSPSAFEGMREEDLRQHFLVQLNGQYDGMATGETFNFLGKTDILIRYEGRNVFISECKFWKGKKALLKTIDQLLRYTSWRDTKTAIILFNRGRNFSVVLAKIPDSVKSHICFKGEGGKKRETEFRFIFRQPDDPNRELILSILVFNVPIPDRTDRD